MLCVTKTLLALCILIAPILASKSANVLFVVTVPFYGHQKLHQRIWDELALRGHNVTVITTAPLLELSAPGVLEVNLASLHDKYFLKLKEPAQINFTQPTLLQKAARHRYIASVYDEFAEKVLGHKNLREFLAKENSFDVCVVEANYPAVLGFAAKFGCSLVVTSSSGFPKPYLEAVNNFPSSASPNATKLFDKVLNSLYSIYEQVYYKTVILPTQDKIVKKYLGEDLPYLEEVQKNTSLVLVNRNPVLDDVLPLLPHVVDIGGVYTSKPKTYVHLGLHIWLNVSKHVGAIGFNLEPNVKSHRLPKELINLFQESFSSLNQDVVWKWEAKKMTDQPINVYITDYLPQYDMMDYENVTLLITEGYVFGIEDAISSGIPIIGIPFTAESEATLEKYLKHGIGRRLHIHNLTADVLTQTINEVINNPIYKQNAIKLNQTLHDLPMNGLETAIWWIDYVIRRNGTAEIKNSLVTIPLYQYYFLDVIAVLLVLLGLIIYVPYKIIKVVVKKLVALTKKKEKIQEKKNK